MIIINIKLFNVKQFSRTASVRVISLEGRKLQEPDSSNIGVSEIRHTYILKDGLGIKKRRHPDLNRGIEVLQTSALPLGYTAQEIKAGNETRTRDSHLGKVVLYQLSYSRLKRFDTRTLGWLQYISALGVVN